MSLLERTGMAQSAPDLAASGTSVRSKGAASGAGALLSETETSWPLQPMLPLTTQQRLQASLYDRQRGGPREQILSPTQRMRKCRSTEILHSSLEEPLTTWKSLEPVRPKWPTLWRRYHLKDGIRVKDQDTILVEARDTMVKTKKGLLRDSSGFVTYSETHRRKVEIDAIFLAQIVNGGIPGGGHAWTPKVLERIFKERTGRIGSWNHYEVPIKHFLALFPKTFQQFGPDMQFVRLRNLLRPVLVDDSEDAMSRLACARERGFIEPQPHIEGTVGLHNEELMETFAAIDDGQATSFADIKLNLRAKTACLPELRDHRMKVAYKSTDVRAVTPNLARKPFSR